MGKYEEATRLTHELDQLQGAKGFNTYDVKVKIFTCVYTSQITISYRKGDFQSTLKIVEEMIEGLETYGDKLPKEQIILFSYHIAYVFFGAGLYRDALKWVNTILNDNEQNLRQDIYSYTRIFNLILHYELGNYDLLEYLMKSTTRQIKKNSKTEMVEMSILKFLKKVIRLGDKAKVKAFEAYLLEMDEILTMENQSAILEYFHVRAWVSSKIHNESFEETIKKMH
jgi:hypothetical protein